MKTAGMTQGEKALRIIETIRDLCNESDTKKVQVAFAQDWGGNSLTVFLPDGEHAHVGATGGEGTLDCLIDSVYAALCEEA